MQNLNGVFEFIKGQIQEREDEWKKERQQYQQTISELRTQLEDQKSINTVLKERLESIKFAFQPITENMKRPIKTKKNLHRRVKSDTGTFLKNESQPGDANRQIQMTQPNIQRSKKLLNNFLKELEESEPAYMSVPINVQLPQATKIHQIVINQNTFSQKHHHQRSNSNGNATASLFSLNLNRMMMNRIDSNQELNQTQRINENVVGKDIVELKGYLRSHLDGVRSVVFQHNIMATASEDCTIKIWSTDQLKKMGTNTHMDPLHTVRQHLGPIFTMTSFYKAPMIHLYSGGADGCIRSCSLATDPKQETLFSWHAHTDVIWSLKHHPRDMRLLSSSADGSVKMWKSLDLQHQQQEGNLDLEMLQNPLANFTFKKSMNGLSIPTAINWVCRSNNNENIVCGYNDTLNFIIYDVASVKIAQQIRFQQDYNTNNVQPNTIINNSDLKYIVSGHEDHNIRFCDMTSGKIIKSFVGHTDSVTDLCFLQNVNHLGSVSHDGSLRAWDIRKFQCLHEIPAHKRKYDEGIHSISSQNNLVATGGADGIVKIFNYSDVI